MNLKREYNPPKQKVTINLTSSRETFEKLTKISKKELSKRLGVEVIDIRLVEEDE